MALEDFCLFCQQWDVGHETAWCPQTTCRKCGENGHTIKHCQDSFQFFQLPDELLLQILGYLCSYNLANCAQVSKRWRNIVLDKKLQCQSFHGECEEFQNIVYNCR